MSLLPNLRGVVIHLVQILHDLIKCGGPLLREKLLKNKPEASEEQVGPGYLMTPDEPPLIHRNKVRPQNYGLRLPGCFSRVSSRCIWDC